MLSPGIETLDTAAENHCSVNWTTRTAVLPLFLLGFKARQHSMGHTAPNLRMKMELRPITRVVWSTCWYEGVMLVHFNRLLRYACVVLPWYELYGMWSRLNPVAYLTWNTENREDCLQLPSYNRNRDEIRSYYLVHYLTVYFTVRNCRAKL